MAPPAKANGSSCAVHPVAAGVELIPQIAPHVEVSGARTAAEPLHASAGGEIHAQFAHVDGQRAGRLIKIRHHHRAHGVRAPHDRRQVLHIGAAKRHVRDRYQRGLLIDRVQNQFHRQGETVGRRHRHDARSAALQRMIDVIVGRKVEAVGDQFVAPRAPIEAGRDYVLADGDVLLDHHLALSRADNTAHQIAHRDRHHPPAFFPGAYAALGPGVGELLHARPGAFGHGAQRVADHVGGVRQDGELLAPGQQRISQ